LFIILPPNLDQAVGRGKVMLVFRSKMGGDDPLNALPKGRAYAVSSQENLLIDRIEEWPTAKLTSLSNWILRILEHCFLAGRK